MRPSSMRNAVVNYRTPYVEQDLAWTLTMVSVSSCRRMDAPVESRSIGSLIGVSSTDRNVP